MTNDPLSADELAVRAAAISIASLGEKCDVCLREGAFAVGRMSGVVLTTGVRYSAPVCDECMQLLFTGDWDRLERLVFQYQASDWTFWESVVHRRHARQVARKIASLNRKLFDNLLSDPDDAPRERSVIA